MSTVLLVIPGDKKWAWLIKVGVVAKNFRAIRAQLNLQTHHTKNPKSTPGITAQVNKLETVASSLR